jgi:hypothetical protein
LECILEAGLEKRQRLELPSDQGLEVDVKGILKVGVEAMESVGKEFCESGLEEKLEQGLEVDVTLFRPESHPTRKGPHMNRKRILYSRVQHITQRQVRSPCRFRKSRIRPNIASARIAADPQGPAYESEADPVKSCPTNKGHERIRCRFREDRIGSNIASARIASDS